MMLMSPSLRRFALTAHITSSVSWIGAVASFLALAIAGLVSQDAQLVRSAYLAMDLTGWFVIVPLSFASLLTGVVQSIGTNWGLFRHYWVLAKLLITVVATLVLLLHMQPTSHLAKVAAESVLSDADLRELRTQLVADACVALIVLLVAVALSVYKPQGLTPFGQRKSVALGADSINGMSSRTPLWVRGAGIFVMLLILLFVIRHLTGGGFRAH